MEGPFCPRYHHAVELIGRRWTGAILRAMFAGATRFCELTGAVPDLSDRMLSERLKELELEGVVVRQVQREPTSRIEYHLTDKGRALQPVLDALASWAEAWVSDPDADPTASGDTAATSGPEGTHAR